MFKVEIKKDNVITHGTQFETQAECEAWYVENTVAFPEEHEVEHTDITAALLAAKEKAEALKYLSDTDWYIIRKNETGVEIPAEVTTNRAAARLKA